MNSTRINKLILSLLFLCLATTGRAQTFPRLLFEWGLSRPVHHQGRKRLLHDKLIFQLRTGTAHLALYRFGELDPHSPCTPCSTVRSTLQTW